MNRDDLIWLAGLLEGEGSFDMHRGKYPRVRVGMTDRDVVGRVASLIGSSIRLRMKRAPHKPMFHASISGDRAAVLMEALLPFMGARRSSAIAAVLGEYRLSRMPDAPQSVTGPALVRPPGFAPHD